MRLRPALTVGVCLLLFCASSLASACELSCSLPATHHHASLTGVNHSSGTMSHSHCAHMQMRGAKNSWPNTAASTSGCVARACWRPEAFSPAVKASGIAGSADRLTAVSIGDQGQPFLNAHGASGVQPRLRHAVSPPDLFLVLRI